MNLFRVTRLVEDKVNTSFLINDDEEGRKWLDTFIGDIKACSHPLASLVVEEFAAVNRIEYVPENPMKLVS